LHVSQTASIDHPESIASGPPISSWSRGTNIPREDFLIPSFNSRNQLVPIVPAVPTAEFYRKVQSLCSTQCCSLFKSFKWFDGLGMSGFILNRCAPFNALRRFRVQEFKVELPRFENSRSVERFAKQREAMQFDNIGKENASS